MRVKLFYLSSQGVSSSLVAVVLLSVLHIFTEVAAMHIIGISV